MKEEREEALAVAEIAGALEEINNAARISFEGLKLIRDQSIQILRIVWVSGSTYAFTDPPSIRYGTYVKVFSTV